MGRICPSWTLVLDVFSYPEIGVACCWKSSTNGIYQPSFPAGQQRAIALTVDSGSTASQFVFCLGLKAFVVQLEQTIHSISVKSNRSLGWAKVRCRYSVYCVQVGTPLEVGVSVRGVARIRSGWHLHWHHDCKLRIKWHDIHTRAYFECEVHDNQLCVDLGISLIHWKTFNF